MLPKYVKDFIFVRNTKVTTFLGYEFSGCFRLGTGLSKVALESVNNSFRVNIGGTYDFHAVIKCIVRTDLFFSKSSQFSMLREKDFIHQS